MNHELRILHNKFIDGEISRQEFDEYIQTELSKLEDGTDGRCYYSG